MINFWSIQSQSKVLLSRCVYLSNQPVRGPDIPLGCENFIHKGDGESCTYQNASQEEIRVRWKEYLLILLGWELRALPGLPLLLIWLGL